MKLAKIWGKDTDYLIIFNIMEQGVSPGDMHIATLMECISGWVIKCSPSNTPQF